MDYIDTMNHFDQCLPEIKLILIQIAQEFKDTPVEDQIYKFCKRIEKDSNFFNEWFLKQKDIIVKLFLACFPSDIDKHNKKEIRKFYTSFQKHLASVEYDSATIDLLHVYDCTEKGPEFQFLTSVMFDI